MMTWSRQLQYCPRHPPPEMHVPVHVYPYSKHRVSYSAILHVSGVYVVERIKEFLHFQGILGFASSLVLPHSFFVQEIVFC